MIIGLNSRGYIGVGKDYIADKICYKIPGFTIYSTSNELVNEVCEAYGIKAETLTSRDTKEQPMERLAARYCKETAFVSEVIIPQGISLDDWMSPRKLMQLWGTEYRRNLFGLNYWVNKIPVGKNLVIPATRYANEFAICDILIQVKSLEFGEFIGYEHPSEVDSPKWDYTIDNNKGTDAIDNLIERLRQDFYYLGNEVCRL